VDLIEVVATVNLWELRAGTRAMVDPADPYIARMLAARMIVPATDERTPDEPDAS